MVADRRPLCLIIDKILGFPSSLPPLKRSDPDQRAETESIIPQAYVIFPLPNFYPYLLNSNHRLIPITYATL